MLLATVLEYLTGIAMMRLFGSLWWDYSHKPFNYKGILCLESSVGWGVLAVLYFRVLEGLVSGYIGAIPVALGKFVCVAALIYFPLDFGYHLYRRLRERREEAADGKPRTIRKGMKVRRRCYLCITAAPVLLISL